jgi:acetylglutamate synthase
MGFFSSYMLPSTIVVHPKHSLVEVAYLYDYASSTAFVENADDLEQLRRRLMDLIADATILADQAKFDVFNTLTLMDNPLFLQELKVRAMMLFLSSMTHDPPPYSSDQAMAYSTSISIIGTQKASPG